MYTIDIAQNMPVLESTQTLLKRVKPLTPPPPVYPRQTTSSLARMVRPLSVAGAIDAFNGRAYDVHMQNTCQKRLRSTSLVDTRTIPQGDRRKGGKKKLRLKTQPFYTGEGLNKGIQCSYMQVFMQ